eukprot:12881192-Heterocapsa_arctica.AAC.1
MGTASFGADARRQSIASGHWTAPKAFLRSRERIARSGCKTAAARTAAISCSAPARRPAPYWSGPTAVPSSRSAPRTMAPIANLSGASEHSTGRTDSCNESFQNGRA